MSHHADRPNRSIPSDWKGVEAVPILLDAEVEQDEDGLVFVPYRLPDGTLHRERVVAPNGRRWWSPGEGQIPLGLDLLPGAEARKSALIIAEGESCTLALRFAFGDFFVLGLPGAGSWQRSWKRYVEAFPLVYVIGDGDDAGMAMSRRVREDVPWVRPVQLPRGEDARAILQRSGPRSLDTYLLEADRLALLAFAWQAPTLAKCEAIIREGNGGLSLAA